MSRKLALSLIATSFVVLLGIAFSLAFPLRPLFMKFVVAPLIESFLVLRWYVHRLSQFMLWIAFVTVGALVVVYILTRDNPRRKHEKRRRYILVKSDTASDLRRLTATINRAHHRPFARRRVASELVSLCVRLIAQQERLSLAEARERFESFQWCDDNAVEKFFNFRRQYYGVGLGKAFDRRLRETVAFLERYHQGGTDEH